MHPILIDLKFMPVFSFGAMVALAFFAGLVLVMRRGRELGIDQAFLSDLFLVILVSGIAGARIMYVLLNWPYFAANPLEIVMIQRGGLVVYGGIAASALGSLIFIKAKRYSFFGTIDIFMPYLALGQALGRIGCFLNGCCFGKVTSHALSVVFPANSLPYHDHLEKGLIDAGAARSCAVYPAQLYSSALDLAIFAALAEIDRRKRWNGQTFWCYLILYPLKRFFVEFARGDSPAVLANLTVYQLISAGLLCCGIAGYAIHARVSGNKGTA